MKTRQPRLAVVPEEPDEIDILLATWPARRAAWERWQKLSPAERYAERQARIAAGEKPGVRPWRE